MAKMSELTYCQLLMVQCKWCIQIDRQCHGPPEELRGCTSFRAETEYSAKKYLLFQGILSFFDKPRHFGEVAF